jgi:hypothetical protein
VIAAQGTGRFGASAQTPGVTGCFIRRFWYGRIEHRFWFQAERKISVRTRPKYCGMFRENNGKT